MNASTPIPPKAGGGSYRWQVVAMLWFICFFNYADRQAIFSLFPLFKERFRFTPEQLGQIGAAFTLVYALCAPLAGQVGDRLPRKRLILGGLGVWSAITGLTALCSQVWHFVLVRGAEGLGETFYFPASMSLISDYHGRETRSRAMSIHQTSVYLGTIGGGALAGWMAVRYGWQSPFVVLALLGIGLSLALFRLLREPRRNAAERTGEADGTDDEPIPVRQLLREWARTPAALLLLAAFFGANTVALVFLTWMPTFLKEKFGLNLALAGISATLFIQVASMVGAAMGGVLADHWRNRHPGGRIFVQAVGALLGAPFLYVCGFTRTLPVLIAAMTGFGLFKGLYDSNLWAALYDVIPASRRGTAVGVMNMVGWLGGALGSYGIGAAVSRGATMSAAIASTTVLYLAIAGLLLAAGRSVSRSARASRRMPGDLGIGTNRDARD